MHSDWDAIVVGGGHNGLTAAAYLGRAGLRTLVLEKNPVVGGAAVSEEFHPGYRNSVASYVVSLLQPTVIADLELARHGFSTLALDGTFYPRPDGRHLLLTGEASSDRAQMEAFEAGSHAAMQALHRITDEAGEVLREQWLREPPRLAGAGVGDAIAMLRTGLAFRKLSGEGRQRLLQFLLGSARALIERHFDSEDMRAIFCAGTLSGNYASLYAPGSALPMLHHAVGEVDGVRGRWALARGGMGAITQAMARSAAEHGVQIRTEAEVERLLIDEGRVRGVHLRGGESLHATVVLTNTDPHRTFTRLVGAEHLAPDFVKDIEVWRMESASMRMNLALRGLPEFHALPTGGVVGQHHRSFINIVHSADAIERSYASSRAGELPEHPVMEILIPSTVDDTLAAPGHHVMSLLCKYVPYQLSGGRHWQDMRETAADHMLAYLGRYVKNLDEIVVDRQVLTPWDIEQRFGMTRGDICHGRLEPDQLFSMRPHPQAAQYATPIRGLYLCGSGSHPGGGVTGAPGHNAAQRVIRDWKKLRAR